MESLTIFDATGKAVRVSENLQSEHIELNISDLAEGFYVASARTATGVVAKKFQILR